MTSRLWFDHDDGVAVFDEAVEDVQQHVDVAHVEPGRRLVQHIGGRLLCLPKLLRDLHPLTLTTRQRVQRLPQPQVPQPNRSQLTQRTRDARVGQLGDGLIDGEFVDVGDGQSVHLVREDIRGDATPWHVSQTTSWPSMKARSV